MRQNVCQPFAPSVRAACSCSSPISRSVGTTSRATNGSETKIVAITIAGSANSTSMPALLEPAAEPALAAVEQEEREPDDDGRERERQVDERVQQALAGEPPAHDRERADDPEHGVHGYRDGRDDQRQLEARGSSPARVSASQAGPNAVLERAPEDDRERADEDHEQVAERDEAEAEPRHGRASWRSGGWRRSRGASTNERREQHDRRPPLPPPSRRSRCGRRCRRTRPRSRTGCSR